MSHGLDSSKTGKVRMAYADHQIPWHRLGTAVRGLQTAEEMLKISEADYTVVLTSVAALDEYGELITTVNEDGETVPLLVDDSRATVAIFSDGSFRSLSTVGTRYVVQQNADCLARALDIVGASAGDAVVDTCGVLHEGRSFFASIDLGSLIIDPLGVNDKIERYLLVRNGHDGKTPITYANTSIRAVCQNTVNAGIKSALRVFTARHTRNQDTAIEQAQKVLNISTEWAKDFQETAEKMLKISVPSVSPRLDYVINSVFPKQTDETDRQTKNREEITSLVRGLYPSERNAGNYGFNGWSLYNAIGEYFDHYRDAKPDERAQSSMDPNSWVTKKKFEAQQAILSLA